MYQFRDPIHGFISVSDGELKIINSAPFQRLRNIRQLATTYLVYHGAEHTRFGHSLGVMHLTSRVFDSIAAKNPLLFSKNEEENQKLITWYRQILRLIGLTHDLGHAPFSHASEELFVDGKKHEDYTKQIIFETEIAGYIREIGNEYKKQLGQEYDITPELLWMIYNGDKNTLDKEFVMPDFLFLHGLMDGELDCDKMDYLLRDSHYCGVSYGKYDLERFISTLTVYTDTNNKCMQLAIERGGIQALEEFVLARYFMFIQVYYHKTRRFLDKSLVNALKQILPNGKYPEDVHEYLRWDDNRVLYSLSSSDAPEAKSFCQREIMTCVYESKAHAEKSDQALANVIFTSVKNVYKDGILFDSADKAAHKLMPTLLPPDDDSGNGIMILDEKTNDVVNIMEESVVLTSLFKPISIKRIYAARSIKDQVIKCINDIKESPHN